MGKNKKQTFTFRQSQKRRKKVTCFHGKHYFFFFLQQLTPRGILTLTAQLIFIKPYTFEAKKKLGNALTRALWTFNTSSGKEENSRKP